VDPVVITVPSAYVHRTRPPEYISVITDVLQTQPMPPMITAGKFARVLSLLVAVAPPVTEAREQARVRRCGLIVNEELEVLSRIGTVTDPDAVRANPAQPRRLVHRRAVSRVHDPDRLHPGVRPHSVGLGLAGVVLRAPLRH